MTVTTFLNYKEYQAEGKSTKFCIPFLLLDRNDLNVFIDNKPVTANYTITGLGNPYSEIIFEEAPVGALLLQRAINLLRDTDYQENGDLLAETLNRDFDRLYLAMQGFAQGTTQALRVSDPEGVTTLPLAQARANKTLSFDVSGQPILTTSATGSAAELANKLIDASDPHLGSGLVGYDKMLDYPDRSIGRSLNTLAARFDGVEGNGVPLFSVFWWPSRGSIPAGYVAADGQELSQIIFPDASASIKLGKVPTVQELEWQSDPVKRGSYVSNSSQGMFRVPDYNGKYANSLGALFLRGDGGELVNGEIQKDAIRNISGIISQASAYSPTGPFYTESGIGYQSSNYTGGRVTAMDISRVVPVADENRPINVSGCWIIKLFGATVNAGSVDIQQLVTENAKLASRLSFLEEYQQVKRFTIIYPNNGTKASPANVIKNQRYILDNPFPGTNIIVVAEVFINNTWGETGWLWNSGGYGVKASHIIEEDKVIVQTGSLAVRHPLSSYTGNPMGGVVNSGNAEEKALCRVKVWRCI